MKKGFLRLVFSLTCLLIVGGCTTTKASFRLSLAHRRIQVYESNVSQGQVELLVYVSDREGPVASLSRDDLFIHEDGESVTNSAQVNIAPPPELYLAVLVDTSQESAEMLPCYKWALKQSLRHLTYPAQVRLITYAEGVHDISGTFVRDFSQLEEMIDSLQTDPKETRADLYNALEFGRMALKELPSSPNNITLAGKRPLYNSAILATGRLIREDTARLREHYQDINLLLVHPKRANGPTKGVETELFYPYQPVFAHFPADASVCLERNQLAAQIRRQLNSLTSGYYLLEYQSTFHTGQHDIQLAFDLYGSSASKINVDFSRHTIYQINRERNMLLTASASGRAPLPGGTMESTRALPEAAEQDSVGRRKSPETEDSQHAQTARQKQQAPPPLDADQLPVSPTDNFIVTGMSDHWIAQSDESALATEASKQWYIQLAAFTTQQAGYRFLAPLSELYKVSLLGKPVDGVLYYRCLVGPVGEEQKDKLQQDLINHGYNAHYFLRGDKLIE